MVLKVINKKGEECVIELINGVWVGLKKGELKFFNDLKVSEQDMIDFLIENLITFWIVK